MLTINQVAEADGGEADEGVVHAVEVRPISLDVAEQYGGQQEEYGDSGHHVNKHVEQDLLAGALLFALELFKLKYSFERDENKSQEQLNTQLRYYLSAEKSPKRSDEDAIDGDTEQRIQYADSSPELGLRHTSCILYLSDSNSKRNCLKCYPIDHSEEN